jgi:hypothetical protein
MSSRLVSLAVLTGLMAGPLRAEEHVHISTGLTVSKSILGIGHSRDRNEINAGLKSFSFSSNGEYLLAPGVSYNRALTASGFFATVTYAPLYYKPGVAGQAASRPPAFGGGQPDIKKGWNAGEVYFGLGKTFRFSPQGSWGLDTDANLYTPADKAFLRAWYYRLGAGVSYRFRLD